MHPERSTNGQFSATHSDRDLLRIVRDVALAACPDAPARLSVRAFNRGRALVTQLWHRVPTGSAILQRLNHGRQARITWPSLVRAALGTEDEQRQLVATGQRSEALSLPDDAIFLAVRIAQRETTDPLTPDEYERVRAALLTKRRGEQRALFEMMLPTANQLIRGAGSWQRVLLIGGDANSDEVGEPEAAPDDEPRKARRRPARARRLTGMPVIEAICWFARLQGSLPSADDVRWFGRKHGIGIQQPSRPWREHVAAARAILATEGIELEHDLAPPAHRRRETGERLPDEVIAGAARRGRWKDLDACARALVDFWATLPVRQEPTQAGYRRWATGKPYPAPNTFEKHGGFTSVKERARELRAAEL
jgi:hypothetical protein